MVQRAQVGATEGIAWELLRQLTTIKQAQAKPQSLADMVSEALPGTLMGSKRKGLGLAGVLASLQADSCAHPLPKAKVEGRFAQQQISMKSTPHRDNCKRGTEPTWVARPMQQPRAACADPAFPVSTIQVRCQRCTPLIQACQQRKITQVSRTLPWMYKQRGTSQPRTLQ